MKDKLMATAVHVGMSLIIASLILTLLFWYWFPSPLIGLGAVQGVQLILIVDLVVGPLCTFMVYKKGKPGMLFDLMVIGLLQISAIAYGLFAISEQKPVYLVLNYDGIEVVSRYEQIKNIEDGQRGRMLEDLLADTLRYERRIPVILLNESEDKYLRAAKRLEFGANTGLLHHLNVENYLPVYSLNSIPFITDKILDKENGCYLLQFSSPHGETEACISEQEGELTKK